MAELGRLNTLRIVREERQGVYLDGDTLGEILLPGSLTPRDVKVGDEIEVFLYRDSEDRLIATTETPLACVGEFALMTVRGVHRTIGAFLDWGLQKDLLLPFREMEHPVAEGDQVVVFVQLDTHSNRIQATTRLADHLPPGPPDYAVAQPVDLVITRKTPLGYIALVELSHLGLLYQSLVPRPLRIGERVQGYVSAIRPDGKLDLSLESSGRHAVDTLAERILAELKRNGGRLQIDDDSPPEAIRSAFGASKKAFKQAVGQLYRERRIKLEKPGITLV